MRILITGGSGQVGQAVVRRLVERGDKVKVIGRTPGVEFPGATYEVCDVTDYAALRQAVIGCEAVVHLAAVPNPSSQSSEIVFSTNVLGTFNVFMACEEEGIRRVVQASSINALGQFYGLKPAPLSYLPVDEDHPCFSTDVYSFSKHVIEDIGDYYWRRSGISSVALRLPYVAPETYFTPNQERQKWARGLCDRLMNLPDEARRAWFDHAWSKYNQIRALGFHQNRALSKQMRTDHPEWFGDEWMAINNRVNFWTCLDERDSAQAVDKSLRADISGSHVLFVNDDHNWTGVPTQVLAGLFYPDVKTFKKELTGTDSLVSIDKARRLIGFEIEYSFTRSDR